jgi:Tfp pilus assembly protein PilV
MIEVIVAMVILAGGLLALARASAALVQFAARTDARTQVAMIAQSRFEWMRSGPCASLGDSATTTRGFAEEWTVGPAAATPSATLFVFAPVLRRTATFATALGC